MAGKVPTCAQLAREAVEAGMCAVIGLQSTGEANLNAVSLSILFVAWCSRGSGPVYCCAGAGDRVEPVASNLTVTAGVTGAPAHLFIHLPPPAGSGGGGGPDG
jgi:hypothetical protein